MRCTVKASPGGKYGSGAEEPCRKKFSGAVTKKWTFEMCCDILFTKKSYIGLYGYLFL